MSNTTLLERVCQRHKLSEPDAEERLFRRSVSPLRRPLTRLLRWLNPAIFAHDLNVVHEAGQAVQLSDLNDVADMLHRRCPTQYRFLRVTLGFRISSNRLIQVAKEYFRPEGE
jgi:hypothetical protein